MSLKTIKNKLLVSAFAAVGAVSAIAACGDDGEKPMVGNPSGTGMQGGGTDSGVDPNEPYDLIDYELVGVLDLKPVAAVHKIVLLDQATGKPLDPPKEAMTTAGTGKFSIMGVPGDKNLWIHVIGSGPNATDTYDSLSLGARYSGDKYIRISTVGTATIAETTGAFKAKADQIAVGGAVYLTDPTGRRIGAIGCAQVFLDDETQLPVADDDPATDDAGDPNAIRYVASSGLPAKPSALQKTLKDSGKFFFGNVTKGEHTFKVSMDGGKTFIAEKTFTIPFSRSEAVGPFKGFLVLTGIDYDKADPTPAGCPTM